MYRLKTFGKNSLPVYDYAWDAGTPESLQALISSVGGVTFDAYGVDDAPASLPYSISYKCVAVASTAAALRTTLDTLRAQHGKREKLYRMAESDNEELHFAWARLTQIQVSNTVSDQAMIWQPLTLVFLVLTSWNGIQHGQPWFFDDGVLFDDGAYLDLDDVWTPSASGDTETVNNGGNRSVSNAVLTIRAGASATISDVRIRCGDCDWTWTGTVAVSTILVIDCGRRTVRNDGVDAYSGFAHNTGHKIADWLRLEPGDNTVTINYTGNAGALATVEFNFYDGWM
jgi:hypothetical protein